MALVEIDWRPDRAARRRFGRTVLLGCLVLAAVLGWGRGAWPVARWVAGAGVAGGGLCWLAPGSQAALLVYRAWMGVAFVMGQLVSGVLLAAVWYMVLTPVGLVMRWRGHDPLQRRRRGDASFWRDLPEHGSDLERQF